MSIKGKAKKSWTVRDPKTGVVTTYRWIYRSSVTGFFVSAEFAACNKSTTYRTRQVIKPRA